MSDAELHSVPETDLLKDLAWAEKTFATSPLVKNESKKAKKSFALLFFCSNYPLVGCTET